MDKKYGRLRVLMNKKQNMFWNKIPKGYVETVDGYIVRESEAKIVLDDGVEKYYRAENAPKYDSVRDYEYYKNNVKVKKDGTPVGYYTQEEVQRLKDRIKELEDKYEPTLYHSNGAGICIGSDDIYEVLKGAKDKLSKRGRPKGSKNKK